MYKVGDTVTVTCTLSSDYIEDTWSGNTQEVDGNIRYQIMHSYSFANWTGTNTSTEQSYTFTMPKEDVVITANAKETTRKTNQQIYETNNMNTYSKVWIYYNYDIEESKKIRHHNYSYRETVGYSYGAISTLFSWAYQSYATFKISSWEKFPIYICLFWRH